MTKGIYLFKIEACDIEEKVIFEGEHTWDDVQTRFNEWLYDRAGAHFEEISYEESGSDE